MGVGGVPPSGKGVTREGSLANKGTSLRGMDNNFLFVCVLQVTLAYESIVLYMCEGKVLMDRAEKVMKKRMRRQLRKDKTKSGREHKTIRRYSRVRKRK